MVEVGLVQRPFRALCGLIVIVFIIFILSISLIGAGATIHNWTAGVPLVGGFALKTCTLVNEPKVVACVSGDRWVAVWERSESGGSVVMHPYAFRRSKDMSLHDLNNYPTNGTQFPCLCHENDATSFPSVDCELRTPCMLEVELVTRMQLSDGVFGYAGASSIAIGSLILAAILLALVFVICACSCKRQPTIPLSNFVLDDNEDKL